MPDQPVVVPEVCPAVVPARSALRIAVGRFIVRYVETFAGLAAGQLAITTLNPLATPDVWKAYVLQFVAPAITALYQSLRAAWPAIKALLLEGQPE